MGGVEATVGDNTVHTASDTASTAGQSYHNSIISVCDGVAFLCCPQVLKGV